MEHLTQISASLAVLLALLALMSGRRQEKALRVIRKRQRGLTELIAGTRTAITRVETALPDQEKLRTYLDQHTKVIAQHNAMALDLTKLKDLVAGLNRSANAIGLRKISAGIVPSAEEEKSA